jgi:hypothetical protein
MLHRRPRQPTLRRRASQNATNLRHMAKSLCSGKREPRPAHTQRANPRHTLPFGIYKRQRITPRIARAPVRGARALHARVGRGRGAAGACAVANPCLDPDPRLSTASGGEVTWEGRLQRGISSVCGHAGSPGMGLRKAAKDAHEPPLQIQSQSTHRENLLFLGRFEAAFRELEKIWRYG